MFSVERANVADARQLVGLAHEVMRNQSREAWWNEHLEHADCFVARDAPGGNLLGFAVAEHRGACEAELAALAVATEQRGRGVGGALLRTVQAQLRQSGSLRLHLDVRADNPGARQFYERHGYLADGIVDHAYQDGGSAVRLSRPI